MAAKTKKLPIKVKVKGMSARNAGIPRLSGTGKTTQNRQYKKGALQEDPSKFTNVGFGNTGMTAED
jgi:hypothetical protein